MGSRLSQLFHRHEVHLLMVGLNGAGKTTILRILHQGEVVTTTPTLGFTVETVTHEGVSFTVWDVGGQDKMRPLWRHYYQHCSALIYVIDASDHDRFEEASEELHLLLSEEELAEKPLLVYANKQEVPNAWSVPEVVERLGLHRLRGKQWFASAVSAVADPNSLQAGLNWLQKTLAKSG